MIILSNGFPTNMPDAENVSQGGPANFAKLFTNYVLAKTKERWIGLLYQTTKSQETELVNIFNFPRRNYYKLITPGKQFKKITQATKLLDPAVVLKKQIKLITELIKERKPDVVLLNGFGIIHWIMLKAAEKTNTPVVIQHAGIWTKELEIHKNRYTKHGRKIMELMEKDATRLNSGEVFLNSWSKEYYNSNVAKINKNKTHIIPLPFNFNKFKELNSDSNNSQFYFDSHKLHIGVIARWDNIKNHKLILKVAKLIYKLKLPWEIHVVTEIPETVKNQKMEQEYVKFIDVISPLDRSEISDFCHVVDLLLQPSIFDVSPTVVLEATASKTPIAISENVGYVNDFKKYRAKNWILSNDAITVIKQIKKIIGKPMPLTFRQYIRKAHDHEHVFASYLKLFKKVATK